MRRKTTLEELLYKIKEKGLSLIDVDPTSFVMMTKDCRFICKNHGEFWKKPSEALRTGKGCPSCSREWVKTHNPILAKQSLGEFINKSRKFHGNKYDYSLVEYNGCYTPVTIICPIHGKFYQSPQVHYGWGGCQKCGAETRKKKISYTQEKFISVANTTHNNEFDYSRVSYKNMASKVEIICKLHGPFLQRAKNHINGSKCPKCNYSTLPQNRPLTTEEFLTKAKKVHGDRYDYSKTSYGRTNNCPVSITCNIHGEFLQKPATHLKGSGCKLCNRSKSEIVISDILSRLDISFVEQKSFYGLKGQGNRKPLTYDFAVYNQYGVVFLLEFDGDQHFKNIPYWGGEESLQKYKLNDAIKNEFCEKNKIQLYRLRGNDPLQNSLLKILRTHKLIKD